MKKITCVALMLIFVMSPWFTAFAAERIAQMTVPGCFA